MPAGFSCSTTSNAAPCQIQEVLGYINALVEHSHFKVIILAHEKKFQDDGAYTTIKEKLIGHTFEIRSSPDEALTAFLEEIAHDKVADYLSENRKAILEVYRMSGRKNLHMRYALFDFERFGMVLNDKIWKKKEPMAWLLKVILALSMEYRLVT